MLLKLIHSNIFPHTNKHFFRIPKLLQLLSVQGPQKRIYRLNSIVVYARRMYEYETLADLNITC